MEQSGLFSCLNLSQGEVRRFLFFASLAWLAVASGFCELNGPSIQGDSNRGIGYGRGECPSPHSIRAQQLLNKLMISWKSRGFIMQYELQYKEAMQNASSWISVLIEHGAFNETISGVKISSSYIARLRCLPLNGICSVCAWSKELHIPHRLIEKPVILEDSIKEISRGEISVFLKWKTTERRNTTGYFITIERIPSYCPKLISLNITENWLHLNLSMIYYRINISASNEAGNSPPVTYMVPDFTTADLPVQINVSNQQNVTVITWNLEYEPEYIVVDWGTGKEDMDLKVIFGDERNCSLGNLQPYKLYKVILHAVDKECEGLMSHERTLAMTYFYAVEGVPRIGPANVTIPIVTKHSAIVKWTEIPTEECLGFLQAYRIHYTEILKNLSFVVNVNSSAKQHHLKELKAKTHYHIQISGVTTKGEGAQSQHQYFTTLKYDQGEFEGTIAGLCFGLILTITIAVILCSLVFKRSRKLCWPAVPNPRYSSAIQNMERTFPVALLGSSLQSSLQSQPSNGANKIYVEGNHSKPLSRQESLSVETTTRCIFADHSEAVAEEKLDTTLNPLKIPDKINTSEKGKAVFRSDYVDIEVSHRAMQKLSTSLPTRAVHLPKELPNNSGTGGHPATYFPQDTVKQNQVVLRANTSIHGKMVKA